MGPAHREGRVVIGIIGAAIFIAGCIGYFKHLVREAVQEANEEGRPSKAPPLKMKEYPRPQMTREEWEHYDRTGEKPKPR